MSAGRQLEVPLEVEGLAVSDKDGTFRGGEKEQEYEALVDIEGWIGVPLVYLQASERSEGRPQSPDDD